jgi:hypothetical protein
LTAHGAQKNDLGAPDMLLRRVAISYQCQKAGAIELLPVW